MNPEAQSNIASILTSLIETNRAGVIGVEGAFQPIDFSFLRTFPDKAIQQKVADDFLQASLLAAPSYAGLMSRLAPPLIIGVDDKDSYHLNVKAYLDSRKIQETVNQHLRSFQERLSQAKKVYFSFELSQLDNLQSSYHKGNLGLGPYVQALANRNQEIGPVLSQFLEAYRLEKTLDFPLVEREKQRVLERLTSNLTTEEAGDLVSRGLALRSGQIEFGDFYAALQNLCHQRRIDLSKTPEFNSYIRYVLLADALQGEMLFEELERLEKRTFQKLIQSPEENRLVSLCDQFSLTEKMVQFSLSPTEWTRYQQLNRSLSEMWQELGALLDRQDSLQNIPSLLAFESFYREADKRSQKMVTRLLAARTNKARVLVAGGFHTPDIAAALRRKKTSYVVLSPKMTKIEDKDGAGYLSLFAQAKTPLDKLFQGERLFINPSTNNFSWTGLMVRFWSVSESIRSGLRKVNPPFLQPPIEFSVIPGELPSLWRVSPIQRWSWALLFSQGELLFAWLIPLLSTSSSQMTWVVWIIWGAQSVLFSGWHLANQWKHLTPAQRFVEKLTAMIPGLRGEGETGEEETENGNGNQEGQTKNVADNNSKKFESTVTNPSIASSIEQGKAVAISIQRLRSLNVVELFAGPYETIAERLLADAALADKNAAKRTLLDYLKNFEQRQCLKRALLTAQSLAFDLTVQGSAPDIGFGRLVFLIQEQKPESANPLLNGAVLAHTGAGKKSGNIYEGTIFLHLNTVAAAHGYRGGYNDLLTLLRHEAVDLRRGRHKFKSAEEEEAIRRLWQAARSNISGARENRSRTAVSTPDPNDVYQWLMSLDGPEFQTLYTFQSMGLLDKRSLREFVDKLVRPRFPEFDSSFIEEHPNTRTLLAEVKRQICEPAGLFMTDIAHPGIVREASIEQTPAGYIAEVFYLQYPFGGRGYAEASPWHITVDIAGTESVRQILDQIRGEWIRKSKNPSAFGNFEDEPLGFALWVWGAMAAREATATTVSQIMQASLAEETAHYDLTRLILEVTGKDLSSLQPNEYRALLPLLESMLTPNAALHDFFRWAERLGDADLRVAVIAFLEIEGKLASLSVGNAQGFDDLFTLIYKQGKSDSPYYEIAKRYLLQFLSEPLLGVRLSEPDDWKSYLNSLADDRSVDSLSRLEQRVRRAAADFRSREFIPLAEREDAMRHAYFTNGNGEGKGDGVIYDEFQPPAQAKSTTFLWKQIGSRVLSPTISNETVFTAVWEWCRLFVPFLIANVGSFGPSAQAVLWILSAINAIHFIFIDHPHRDGRTTGLLIILMVGYLGSAVLIPTHPFISAIIILALLISHAIYDYPRINLLRRLELFRPQKSFYSLPWEIKNSSLRTLVQKEIALKISPENEQQIPIYDFAVRQHIGFEERARVHENGDWHKGIQAYIVSKDSQGKVKVLIQKRSDVVDIAKGKYDQSLATQLIGKDRGNPAEALKRGLREELGLHFSDILRSIQIGKEGWIRVVKKYRENESLYNREFISLYLVEIRFRDITPISNKVANAEWVDWEEYVRRIQENPEEFTKTGQFYAFDPLFLSESKKAIDKFLSGNPVNPFPVKRICFYSSLGRYQVILHINNDESVEMIIRDIASKSVDTFKNILTFDVREAKNTQDIEIRFIDKNGCNYLWKDGDLQPTGLEPDRESLKFIEDVFSKYNEALVEMATHANQEEIQILSGIKAKFDHNLKTLWARIMTGQVVLDDRFLLSEGKQASQLPPKTNKLVMLALPGTFDPPGFNHISLLLDALVYASEQRQGERITYMAYLAPVGEHSPGPDGTVWKLNKTSSFERHAMCEKFTAIFAPLIRTSQMSLKYPNDFGTKNALRVLSLNQDPHNVLPGTVLFYLVAGPDTYEKWKSNFDVLLREQKISTPNVDIGMIVFQDPSNVLAANETDSSYQLDVLRDRSILTLRSSDIRTSSSWTLLPKTVREYIQNNGIYKRSNTGSMNGNQIEQPKNLASGKLAQADSTSLLWKYIGSHILSPSISNETVFTAVWEWCRLFVPFLIANVGSFGPSAQAVLWILSAINAIHFIFIDHPHRDGRTTGLLTILMVGYLGSAVLIPTHPFISAIIILALLISHAIYDYPRINLLHRLESLDQEKFFYEWMGTFEQFRRLSKQRPQRFSSITLHFATANGRIWERTISYPKKLSRLAESVLIRYVAVTIHNVLWMQGAYAVWIDTEQTKLFKEIHDTVETDYVRLRNPGSVQMIIKSNYGMDSFSIVDNETDLLEVKSRYQAIESSLDTQPRISRNTGNLLVINVGVTEIKTAVVHRTGNEPAKFVGNPIAIQTKAPENSSHSVDQFLRQVTEEGRKALQRAKLKPEEIDGIVVGMAVFSPQGRASPQQAGVFQNVSGDLLESVSRLDDYLSNEFGGKPAWCINDGDLQALATSGLADKRDFALLRHGSFLTPGVVDNHGKIIDGVNELTRVIVDMSPDALVHPKVGTKGKAGQYTAVRGINMIATRNGLVSKYGIAQEKDIQTTLEAWLESDDANPETDIKRQEAKAVFEEVGVWTAALARQLKAEYGIRQFVLGGKFYNGNAGKIVFEKMRQLLADEGVEVSIFAESEHALKFNGLLGAAYLIAENADQPRHDGRFKEQEETAYTISPVESANKLLAVVSNQPINQFYFDRVHRSLTIAGKPTDSFRVIQEPVATLVNRFKQQNPNVQILGNPLINSNLGLNDGTVLYADGRLYANAEELQKNVIGDRVYYSSRRHYYALVQWEEGHRSIEEFRFEEFIPSDDNNHPHVFMGGKILIRDKSEKSFVRFVPLTHPTSIIYSGQPLILENDSVPLDSLVDQVADMNHFFTLPRIVMSNGQFLYFGTSELLSDRDKLVRALRGETIALSLLELAGTENLPDLFEEFGYTKVAQENLIDRAGQYSINEQSVFIKLLPGLNPLSLIAIKENGETDIVVIPGESRFVGGSLAVVQARLKKRGYKDVLLFAEGKDVADGIANRNSHSSSILLKVKELYTDPVISEELDLIPGLKYKGFHIGTSAKISGKLFIIDPHQVAISQSINEQVLAWRSDLPRTPIPGFPIQGHINRADESRAIVALSGSQPDFLKPNAIAFQDGNLILRSEGAPGIEQERYELPNGIFWVLDLDQPRVVKVRLFEGKLEPDQGDTPPANGFGGMLLIKDGKSVLDSNADPDQRISLDRKPAINGNDIWWKTLDEPVAMAAWGYNQDGQLIAIQLASTWDSPGKEESTRTSGVEPTVRQLVGVLLSLGVQNAILGPLSGGLQGASRGEELSVWWAKARTGSAWGHQQRPVAHALLFTKKSQVGETAIRRVSLGKETAESDSSTSSGSVGLSPWFMNHFIPIIHRFFAHLTDREISALGGAEEFIYSAVTGGLVGWLIGLMLNNSLGWPVEFGFVWGALLSIGHVMFDHWNQMMVWNRGKLTVRGPPTEKDPNRLPVEARLRLQLFFTIALIPRLLYLAVIFYLFQFVGAWSILAALPVALVSHGILNILSFKWDGVVGMGGIKKPDEELPQQRIFSLVHANQFNIRRADKYEIEFEFQVHLSGPEVPLSRVVELAKLSVFIHARIPGQLEFRDVPVHYLSVLRREPATGAYIVSGRISQNELERHLSRNSRLGAIEFVPWIKSEHESDKKLWLNRNNIPFFNFEYDFGYKAPGGMAELEYEEMSENIDSDLVALDKNLAPFLNHLRVEHEGQSYPVEGILVRPSDLLKKQLSILSLGEALKKTGPIGIGTSLIDGEGLKVQRISIIEKNEQQRAVLVLSEEPRAISAEAVEFSLRDDPPLTVLNKQDLIDGDISHGKWEGIIRQYQQLARALQNPLGNYPDVVELLVPEVTANQIVNALTEARGRYIPSDSLILRTDEMPDSQTRTLANQPGHPLFLVIPCKEIRPGVLVAVADAILESRQLLEELGISQQRQEQMFRLMIPASGLASRNKLFAPFGKLLMPTRKLGVPFLYVQLMQMLQLYDCTVRGRWVINSDNVFSLSEPPRFDSSRINILCNHLPSEDPNIPNSGVVTETRELNGHLYVEGFIEKRGPEFFKKSFAFGRVYPVNMGPTFFPAHTEQTLIDNYRWDQWRGENADLTLRALFEPALMTAREWINVARDGYDNSLRGVAARDKPVASAVWNKIWRSAKDLLDASSGHFAIAEAGEEAHWVHIGSDQELVAAMNHPLLYGAAFGANRVRKQKNQTQEGENSTFPVILTQNGYTLLKSFSRGGSSAQVFLALNSSGQKVIVKYSNWTGISGNGVPWLRAQYRRLMELQESYPPDAIPLYYRSLDYYERPSGDEAYLVLEYLEGAEDITEYFFRDELTADDMMTEIDGIVGLIAKTHYRHHMEPFPDELYRNYAARVRHRIRMLASRSEQVYGRLILGRRFHLGNLDYIDASYFYQDLMRDDHILINGQRYPNLPVLLDVFYDHLQDLQKKFGPSHYCRYGHGDLPLRNVLRLPDGRLVLSDLRGQFSHHSSPSQTSVEYDLAKICHSFFLELVRERHYQLNAERHLGTFHFNFHFENTPGVRKYLEAWRKFPERLKANQAVQTLFEGVTSDWFGHVRLGEAIDYASDIIHRFNQDSSGRDALMYYLQATMALYEFLKEEALLPERFNNPVADQQSYRSVGRLIDLADVPRERVMTINIAPPQAPPEYVDLLIPENFQPHQPVEIAGLATDFDGVHAPEDGISPILPENLWQVARLMYEDYPQENLPQILIVSGSSLTPLGKTGGLMDRLINPLFTEMRSVGRQDQLKRLVLQTAGNGTRVAFSDHGLMLPPTRGYLDRVISEEDGLIISKALIKVYLEGRSNLIGVSSDFISHWKELLNEVEGAKSIVELKRILDERGPQYGIDQTLRFHHKGALISISEHDVKKCPDMSQAAKKIEEQLTGQTGFNDYQIVFGDAMLIVTRLDKSVVVRAEMGLWPRQRGVILKLGDSGFDTFLFHPEVSSGQFSLSYFLGRQDLVSHVPHVLTVRDEKGKDNVQHKGPARILRIIIDAAMAQRPWADTPYLQTHHGEFISLSQIQRRSGKTIAQLVKKALNDTPPKAASPPNNGIPFLFGLFSPVEIFNVINFAPIDHSNNDMTSALMSISLVIDTLWEALNVMIAPVSIFAAVMVLLVVHAWFIYRISNQADQAPMEREHQSNRDLTSDRVRGEATNIAQLTLALSRDDWDEALKILMQTSSLGLDAQISKLSQTEPLSWRHLFQSEQFQTLVGEELRRLGKTEGKEFEWTPNIQSALRLILSAVYSDTSVDDSKTQLFAFFGSKPTDTRILLAKWWLGLGKEVQFLVPKGQEAEYQRLAKLLRVEMRSYDPEICPKRDPGGRPNMSLKEFNSLFNSKASPASVIYSGWVIQDHHHRAIDLDELIPEFLHLGPQQEQVLAILKAIATAA
ncbi:MAG: Isopentenyl-diphosphate Delta-isomerase [Elusimicrobia bacterium]|nr:Isopentenyl-diphosphate Delta-isomerase [Elusimicrobiota bacterium]